MRSIWFLILQRVRVDSESLPDNLAAAWSFLTILCPPHCAIDRDAIELVESERFDSEGPAVLNLFIESPETGKWE